MISVKAIFFILCLNLLTLAQSSQNGLIVTSETGTYTGIINGTAPNVRQFLKIPFAQPPVDDLRWEPPAKVTTNTSVKHDATTYPPSCPQYVTSVKSVYNQDVPEYLIYDYNQSTTSGSFAYATSEDCLYLAVWTPAGNASGLPVIVFMTGGGFVTGGIDIPYQLPHHWVERTQSHIVVTINYRVNIMGFPNAAGLDSQNLGLLDQRAALEWVRDSIEAFGGSPEKITLWGQSAGAVSTDMQNFAFPSDPIAKGFFMQSGSVFLDLTSKDNSHTNFSFVASSLGCGNLNASAELACMRAVPVADIENFVGRYQDAGTEPAIDFLPVADETVVFANYTDRHLKGLHAPGPAIYSNTQNEGAALVTYPSDPSVAGPNQTAADATTDSAFLCPAARSAALRTAMNFTTYRYEFAGNFSNVSPRWWMGPYHASDLPFMFASHQDARGMSTQQEFAVSEAMEDFVLGFMKDPENAVSTGQDGGQWPDYATGTMLRFGEDQNVVERVPVGEVEGVCDG